MSGAQGGAPAGVTTQAIPAGGAAPAVGQTDADVIKSLEGMFEAEEQPRRRTPAPSQDSPVSDDGADAGPDEAEASEITGDEEEGAEPDEPQEEDDRPAIEPPASWNAADRAVFAKAPPEVQEVFARRQNEADRYLQQRTQQIAEESRVSAMERRREADEYVQNVQRLLFVASPEAEKFQNVDWQRLAREDPNTYVALSAERDSLRGRISTLQNEINRVSYQTQQQEAAYKERVKVEQLQLLKQKMPILADPQRGAQFAREMGTWLMDQGFSPEEIGEVFDHRVFLVIDKAMRADKAAAVRRTVQPDRAPAPTVQPSGTKQRTDRTAAQRRAQNMAALRKSGSQADAIEVLKDLL